MEPRQILDETSQDIPTFLGLLFSSMTDGVAVFDATGIISSCNPAMGVIAGRSVADIIGKTAAEAWDGRGIAEYDLQSPTLTEEPIMRPDGSVRIVSVRAFAVSAKNAVAAAVYRDVTRILEAERIRRESEEEFRFLLENVNDGILISQGGNLLYVNRHLANMLGHRQEDLIGKPRAFLGVSEKVVAASPNGTPFPDQPTGPQRHEMIFQRRDESLMDVEVNVTPSTYHGKPATFEIIRDITLRKRNQKRASAFLELGQRLNLAGTPKEAARVIFDLAGTLIGWDACTLDLFDITDPKGIVSVLYMDTINGRLKDVLPPESGPDDVSLIRHVIEEGPKLILRGPNSPSQPSFTPFGDVSRQSLSLMLVPVRRGQATIGVMSLQSYSPNAYSANDLEALLALADHCGGALERTRAETRLRESETRYRQMFERSSAMKLLIDPATGAIVDANPAACRFYGYELRDLRAMSFSDINTQADQAVEKEINQALAGERTRFSFCHRLASGDVRDVEVYSNPITVNGRVLLHSIIHDVTGRFIAEERNESVKELGRRLSGSVSSIEVARVVTEIADRLIGWDACFLVLVAADAEHTTESGPLIVPILHVDEIDGERSEVPPSNSVIKPRSATHRTLTEGAQLILREPSAVTTGGQKFGDISRPAASLMYVPIRSSSGAIGVLSIQSYTYNAYSTEDLDLLQTLADHCSGALERTRAEEQIRLLESAVRYASDMVIITVADPTSKTGSRIVFVNDAFERVSGYSRNELIGKNPLIFLGPETDKQTLERMRIALQALNPISGELAQYRKDGSRYDIEFSAFPILDSHSKTRYFVSVQRDVTARKIATQQLVYQAFHDALTGLPNRNLFFERLEHAMARSKRNGEIFAVLFLDLDGFKHVNDSLGHAAGDIFLVEIGRRLETCVRPGDSVARLGGDEFTILLEGIADRADATNITARILSCIEEPYVISGESMKCTASVGIAFQEPDQMDAQELLRHADLALYLAKSHGKSRYEIYFKQ